MTASSEVVCLLSDEGQVLGTALKEGFHTPETPLHLGFSCHVFHKDTDLYLVSRRALVKATWPGVWSNSFCGHPAPGETLPQAACRRGLDELGLELDSITVIDEAFRYRAVDDSGVVENEICPLMVASTVADPQPRTDEVMAWHWMRVRDVFASVEATPKVWSPWFVEEVPILRQHLYRRGLA